MKHILTLFALLLLLSSYTHAAPVGRDDRTQDRNDGPRRTLKDAFADNAASERSTGFLIGAAIDYGELRDTSTVLHELIGREFSALVCENSMKADHTEPQEGVFNFAAADAVVDYAQRNGQVVTGHCLVWHSQCPAWMFSPDGTEQDLPAAEGGGKVSRETLIRRMRNHINGVCGHYRGKVKGWDVVNEAIEGDGSWRQSEYYRILGEDFIALAFQFAHEADPDAELYYNDYGLDSPRKRDAVVRLIRNLKARGLRIDAVGMQSHLSLWTDLDEYERSIEAFAAEGVKVMATELDVSVLPWPGSVNPELVEGPNADISTSFEYQERYNPYRDGLPDDVQAQQADFYRRLFAIYRRHADVISRVTFWGVHDGTSWLNNFPIRGRTNYPLLFDRNLQRKPFVDDIIRDADERSTTDHCNDY